MSYKKSLAILFFSCITYLVSKSILGTMDTYQITQRLELDSSESSFIHVWCLLVTVSWGSRGLSTFASPYELVCDFYSLVAKFQGQVS
jgi:hypothetical protein